MNQTIGQKYDSSPPLLAVTMGDPAGIGPEICLKLAAENPEPDVNLVIFGDRTILDETADQLPLPKIEQSCDVNQLDRSSPSPLIADFATPNIGDVQSGHVTPIAGTAAYNYLNKAIDFALAGRIDAIVTGPINKLALKAAKIDFPGHTEVLAERTQSPDYCMMQYSSELVCTFATTHIGYRDVIPALTTDRIYTVLHLTDKAVRALKQRPPRIVVCGLNPHAGESGLFGNGEEENIIRPAIEKAIADGLNVEGPLPPDTCFIPAKRKNTDAFVCMYHDQGHIPLKALAFDSAVNVTLGLPIIRTSVDHGTAFDIVGQKKADPSSLIQAVKLAAKLHNQSRNRDRDLKSDSKV